MTFKRALQSIGIACMVAVLTASATQAISSGGIGGRPANPDPNNPRTSSIFLYTMRGGEQKNDAMYVNNATDRKQVIELYPVDGIVTNTGSYTCEQKVEARNSIGSWIKLAKNEVTLEAGANTIVPFTVTVPQKADVGEHMGCIAIQSKTQSPDQSRAGVQIFTRQAVRIALIVPGDIKRDITISKFEVAQKSGTQNYTVELTNKGNVSADVDVKVTLKDLFGGTFYKAGGQQPVLPDTTLKLPYSNDKAPFWGGWYSAETSIAYDKRPGVFGLPDSGQLITKSSGQQIIFFMPSWIVIAGAVLLAAIIAWVLWRHRAGGRPARSGRGSKKTAQKRELLWGAYQVKQGETVKSLASRYGVSWEKLATINRLAPPYEIKAGQKIYVPKGYKK